MKNIVSRIVLYGCCLVPMLVSAQTGVTVVGDVYIAPGGQVAIHTDELTLGANVQGDGEVVMAAKTRQRIHAKGHRINRLTISNPAGVDVVSDLVVLVALNSPVGELRLIDARLTVPNDGVINARDRYKIRLVGQGIVLVQSPERATAQTRSSNGSSSRVGTALLPDDTDRTTPVVWHTTVVIQRAQQNLPTYSSDIRLPPPEES